MPQPTTQQASLLHPLALTSPVPLTQHPAAVYLSLLGKGSRPTMKQALDAIASLLTEGVCDAMTLDWAALRYQHTAAVQAALLEQHAPSTASKKICALRRVLEEAWKLELIEDLDYSRAIRLPRIKKNSPKLQGRALSQKEISKLMDVCCNDSTVLGIRDTALIAILRVTGARRSEMANLELLDFSKEIDEEGNDTASLEIRGGKGGKDRTVYLPEEAIAYLERWLEVRGPHPGALLHPLRKGGRIERKHMTPQAILAIVKKRGKKAGIESFTPHDFRRTFCSDLFDCQTDIVTIQELAGHHSPVTTAKYNRRKDKTKRRAVRNLKL